MMKIGLDAQINAVELEILSHRGHVANLQRLLIKKQREPFHVEQAEAKIPQLEAVLSTLKWLKQNEKIIREKISQKID